MELHELQVGQLGAGAERRGGPVPGGLLGVGGRGEHLADAAGGEHHGAAERGADAVARPLADDVQADAAGPAGAAVGVRRAGEHVEDERVLDHLDARVVAHGLEGGDERAGDLGAGGVAAGVHDPVGVVAALAGQQHLAVGAGVEVRAERDQVVDPVPGPR